MQGRGEEGLALFRQSLEDIQQLEVGLGRSWALGMLAEAHGTMGQPAEGLRLLPEAYQAAERTGGAGIRQSSIA